MRVQSGFPSTSVACFYLMLVLFSSSALSEVLLLNYSDFGPQVAAYRLLGPEWWQWESHGDPDPKKKYDINVVVFHEELEEEVKKRFSIVPLDEIDYRWISLDEALQYLNEEISEDILGVTTARLVATRKKLLNHFPIDAEYD